MKLLLGLLGSLLLTGSVAAQEETPPVFQDEIVVAASRSPESLSETTAAVSVIGREEIAARPAESLAEVLEVVPGFHVLFSSAAGSIPILASRGFFGGGEVEYVQLRVDGVPIGDVESGLVDLSRIRARQIDRIEVLRGAGSSLYGDTALGGVIDITTRSDPKPRWGLLSLSAGSFDSFFTDVAIGFQPWHLSFSHAGGDGYRDGSEHQLNSLDLRWRAPGSPFDWSGAGSFARRELHDPGLLSRAEIDSDPTQSNPRFRFDQETTDRYRLTGSFTKSTGPTPLSGEFHAGYKNLDSIRTLLIVAGLGDTISRQLETSLAGASVRGEHTSQFRGRDLESRAGIDLGYETLTSAYRSVEPDGSIGQRVAAVDGTRRRTGLYMTEEWTASERVSIHGGVRFDEIADDFQSTSRRDQAWSPRLGMNARVRASERAVTSLFAQISRAFKAPTLDQRFDARPIPDFEGGTFTISNSELRAQHARSFEMGLSHQQDRLRAQLVAYRTEVDDEIDFDPSTFVYRNIGQSVHQGLELSVRAETSALKPRLDYTWSRVWVPAMPDNQLKNMPEHLLRAGMTLGLGARVQLDLGARWIGGRYLDDANEFPMSDVTLIDSRLRYTIGRLTANADIRNLSAEEYEEVGLTLFDFEGHLVPYAYPGAGRELRVELEVDF